MAVGALAVIVDIQPFSFGVLSMPEADRAAHREET
jgi:hypothetical protein